MIFVQDRVGGAIGGWAHDFYVSIARAEIVRVQRQAVASTLPRWIQDSLEARVTDKLSKNLASRGDSVGLGFEAPALRFIEELCP